MHEIDVFLLKDSSGKASIKVEPELIGVHSGDTVFWHFHSLLGDDAKWVEIEIAPGDDRVASPFFECRGDSPEARCWTELKWGHGHLVATAPDLAPRPGIRNNKYFVRAYNSEPTVYDPASASVTEDPNIIVCDP